MHAPNLGNHDSRFSRRKRRLPPMAPASFGTVKLFRVKSVICNSQPHSSIVKRVPSIFREHSSVLCLFSCSVVSELWIIHQLFLFSRGVARKRIPRDRSSGVPTLLRIDSSVRTDVCMYKRCQRDGRMYKMFSILVSYSSKRSLSKPVSCQSCF